MRQYAASPGAGPGVPVARGRQTQTTPRRQTTAGRSVGPRPGVLQKTAEGQVRSHGHEDRREVPRRAHIRGDQEGPRQGSSFDALTQEDVNLMLSHVNSAPRPAVAKVTASSQAATGSGSIVPNSGTFVWAGERRRPGSRLGDVIRDLSAARTATRLGQCRESRARRTREFARSTRRASRSKPATPGCQP